MRVPSIAGQALLVTGDGVDADSCTVEAYERAGDGWRRLHSWAGHNGRGGWTTEHREGDLRSPAGVFGLSDAGGRLPDPGTRLPYDRSDLFRSSGTAPDGRSLAGTFDHVVAVDYNRVTGRSPLDPERPDGPALGGGIWLHVDHGGGSRGCVTVPLKAMVRLLRWLDPEQHPVVVMGAAASLSD